MIAELGHFCLILALLTALAQAGTGARITAYLQCALSGAALLALITAYIVTDLSLVNVVANSHSLKPLLYRIAGSWGNHEGSMLLWIFMLALFGALVAFFQRGQDAFIKKTIAVQGALGAGFIGFSLFTSNPFLRVFFPPIDGRGLNPVLQDPALAFHPPLLYAGYVGFSVVFSMAVAALLCRKMDRDIAALMRPWALLAWTCLSGGIALGSYWAYYELGWGGFWFWDPVENASLVPWLVGTALLHSVLITHYRGTLARWTLLLAILTFSMSLLGTFLVRSGALTSVHAFAVDPERGLFILALLVLYTGGALGLFAARAHSFRSDFPINPVGREGALLLNNLFLSVIAATVLTGTLYPLLIEAVGGAPVSVGAPYFNATVLPLCVPLLLLMGAGITLPWQGRVDWRATFARLSVPALASMLVVLIVAGLNLAHMIPAMTGMGVASWLIGATLWDAVHRKHIPFAKWGMYCAHLGLGIAVAGMMGASLWAQERAEIMRPGESMTIAGYHLTFEGVNATFGPNYTSATAQLNIAPHRATLSPEKRHYPVAAQNTSEAAIRTTWHDDLYTVLGTQEGDGWIIRAWVHPLVPFLWLGFAMIALGGALSLAARLHLRKGRVI